MGTFSYFFPFQIVALIILIFSSKPGTAADFQQTVTFLQPGETVSCCSTLQERTNFKIFCYDGQPLHLLHTLQSAFLELNASSDKYDLYEGSSVDEVNEKYAKDRASWTISWWSTNQRSREIQLKPFNTTCVGIHTRHDFKLRLVVLRISYYRLLVLACGMLLFFMAPRLGRNTVFHYLSGISVGIAASLLVIIFYLSKMVPKKPVMYSILAGGWMVVIYLVNVAKDNMKFLLQEYKMHITAYIMLSGAISFIICYRMGPVTNDRTMDIIQWGLQAVGIVLVLASSQFQEATVGLAILMLTMHYFPRSWSSRIMLMWRRIFPTQQKYITLAEYEEQGARETEKALSELRQYCNSPECKPWDLSLRLNDSARFAKFVGGESHLSDAELMEYDVKCNLADALTDDSDYDS